MGFVKTPFVSLSKQKLKNMVNEELVQEAVNLFIETRPLEDMGAEDPMFEELYEQECRIYQLFGRMNDEEMNEYRIAVKYIEYLDNRGFFTIFNI
jgi:hypothetical protein